MAPDDARAEDALGWLVRARRGLRSAEALLALEPLEAPDCLFHLQEAVEKAAKATLTALDVPVRRTHDLVALGRALGEFAPGLGARVAAAAPLGAQALALRYPSREQEPSADEARATLIDVRQLVQSVGRWLDETLGLGRDE
jgi:HEPN domain-containing protein